jgi:DNA-binding transcriptional regulator YiaG
MFLLLLPPFFTIDKLSKNLINISYKPPNSGGIMKRRKLSIASLKVKSAMFDLSQRDFTSLNLPPERIRFIRSLFGVTQEEMAAVCGVTRTTYNHWENGWTTPSKESAVHLNKLDEEGRAIYGLPFPSKDYTLPEALQPAAVETLPNLTPEAIKALRKRLGASQEQFASMAGATKTTVVNWEKGYTAPSPTHLARLQEIKSTLLK